MIRFADPDSGLHAGAALHYRLDPEIAIEPARDLLINTIHSFQK